MTQLAQSLKRLFLKKLISHEKIEELQKKEVISEADYKYIIASESR